MKKFFPVLMLFLVLFLLFVSFSDSLAWTPLVSSGDFEGVKADVLTVGTGVVAVSLIILGVFLVVKAIMH